MQDYGNGRTHDLRMNDAALFIRVMKLERLQMKLWKPSGADSGPRFRSLRKDPYCMHLKDQKKGGNRNHRARECERDGIACDIMVSILILRMHDFPDTNAGSVFWQRENKGNSLASSSVYHMIPGGFPKSISSIQATVMYYARHLFPLLLIAWNYSWTPCLGCVLMPLFLSLMISITLSLPFYVLSSPFSVSTRFTGRMRKERILSSFQKQQQVVGWFP